MRTKLPSPRALITLSAVALATPLLAVGGSMVALATGTAALAAAAGPAPNVSATVSSSWQTNDTVWSIAAVHGDVFVGGAFTSVRPPGNPLGKGEVPRTNLAEFNASTGALATSFKPTIGALTGCTTSKTPCGVTALAVSPDGKTLYAGGNFTKVNGLFHSFLAAFSTSTGALVSSWKPSATGPVRSIAPSPDGSTVYVGGDFTKLDGMSRPWAGAVTASTGAILPWAPKLDGTVTSIAVAHDDSRVLVGGDFKTFNGVTQNAIGSTNPSTGASEPWAATILPNVTGCLAQVKDIVISNGVAYIASEGSGGGCFDGDFAATVNNGTLLWQNDCLGATQAIEIVGNWLYKGSHAHDCAFAPGGFPQITTSKGSVDHHLLNQSLADGSLGHWTVNTDNTNLGPRAMATDGTQLFVGGGFTTVNDRPQQGFARFSPGPDVTSPNAPGQPTAISTSRGVDSVSFTAVSDPDNGTLTYRIFRDGGRTPIATLTATSWPWALPVVHYRDAGLTPGSSHTYTVSASDGPNTSSRSKPSASVKVSTTSPSLSYSKTVLADKPSFLWQLSETSGTTAKDASPNGFAGIYEPGTTQGQPGPIAGSTQTATRFDGRTGLVTSANAVSTLPAFSIECWFKTTTNTGGMLVGFGDKQTGLSGTYDRRIYLMNDGQVAFGVANGSGVHAMVSPSVYNDGQWHHVVGTLDPAHGLALYVDGQLVASDPKTTTAQTFTGYWRVGGDNLAGHWNRDPLLTNSQGTTEPNDFFVTGTMGDVAVYPRALSAAQVAAHYAANALSH